MFQVEPILWLQGHASTGLTALMWLISPFGYMPALVALALVLTFGIRLLPSLGVVLALLVTAAHEWPEDRLRTSTAVPGRRACDRTVG